MPLLRVSAERTVPAPAAAVYALLADYRDGHPRILPPAFSDLKVVRGGAGAGTEIRFALRLGGRSKTSRRASTNRNLAACSPRPIRERAL